MLSRGLLLILFSCMSWSAWAKPPAAAMVVSAHALASQAGLAVLQKGGNAFDAAAATALALGVVEPGSSGIGGGGFFLLYIAKQQRYVMIDARETSPALALHGEVYRHASSIDGAQAAAVPGLLAGVDHLIQHYGRLSRQQDTAAALHLAQHGFPVSAHLQRMLKWRQEALSAAAKRVFLAHGAVPSIGWVLKQQALAETLQRFTHLGADDFYRGETAGRLVADLQADGGLIRLSDLAAYRVKERQAVRFHYAGAEFVSASLPSSGGLTLAEFFGILANDDLSKLSELDRTHLLIEAMKRAYRDRNAYLGDADFVSVPHLLDSKRLQVLRASIDMQQATASASLKGFAEPIGASVDTTHFSIIDREGNIVSATLSINYGMGSGYLSPSTGILLNDEMDDFASQPGKPNAYGLIQSKANAIAPGKRMLSSMSPSIIRTQEKSFIVGTPGGSRIISMLALASLAFIEADQKPEQWLQQGRFHHQFLPDVVQYERSAFSPALIQGLQQRGHVLKPMRDYGNMQAIVWTHATGQVLGLSDHRGEGVAVSAQ